MISKTNQFKTFLSLNYKINNKNKFEKLLLLLYIHLFV